MVGGETDIEGFRICERWGDAASGEFGSGSKPPRVWWGAYGEEGPSVDSAL